MSSVEIDLSAIVPHCKRADDGIWYAPSQEALSYSRLGNDECFGFEDSSFWFRHRSACIEAAVLTFPPAQRETIFDIGGGNGFVSLGLMRAGFDVVVVEPGLSGATNSKRRGLPSVVCATSYSAGIPRSSLGAIGLFDVLEHIDEDVAYLASLNALLKRGGRLYATVPAHHALWSAEDDSAGHYRRYTLRALRAALERSAFTVNYATYIFRPLPLPILLFRALPYRLAKARAKARDMLDSNHHVPRETFLTKAILAMLPSEVRVIRSQRSMHFGASCLIVATAN